MWKKNSRFSVFHQDTEFSEPYRYRRTDRPSLILYDLLFSRNTARLADYSALWPFKVIQNHRL